jgi:RNAse (barnase) inhibitor barstar
MDYSRPVFVFMEPESVADNYPGAYVARVSPSVSDEGSLYDGLQKALELPDYFGRNWDALHECLRDFSWIPEKTIVLVHHGVPGLQLETLLTYLRVLADSVSFWRSRNEREHELTVVFPEGSRFEITKLIRESRVPGFTQ